MKVVVIGGGPAGIMAGLHASKLGDEVILLEKMESLGKKLLITGKGRCNITSSIPIDEFIQNVPGNGMFLYSSFSKFTNEDIIKLLKSEGLEVKEERGHRIFPVTDNAKDVLNVFLKLLKKAKVQVITSANVKNIVVEKTESSDLPVVLGVQVENLGIRDENLGIRDENLGICDENLGVHVEKKNKAEQNLENMKTNKCEPKLQFIKADKVILATGGKSYSVTGSTGDGYVLAKKLGHTITEIKPSLVPLVASKKSINICKSLQGLSLRNVKIKLIDNLKNKVIYEDFGEMLFTHWGVSGPTILSSSAHLLRYKNVETLLKEGNIILKIDLKPALSEEKLEERILRDFEKEKNKEFKNSLDELLPKKMIEPMIKLTGIEETKKVNSITKQEREKLLNLLKNFEITIEGFRPIEEAIITSGGVSIKEINPKTMESKLVSGLYFAGEIIDVDAYTGGFNLQIAYSTGYVAGGHKED